MLTLCQYDQDERVAYDWHGDAAGEQGYETYERLVPEPGKTFSDIRPQADWCRVALFLKLCLDEEERKDRGCIRDCIR